MNMSCEAQASSQGFYDSIASYPKGSYREYTQQNGKAVLNGYSLLGVKGGKIILIPPIVYTTQFQVWLLMMVLYLIAGLKLMQWLHWLYDYT